MATHIGSLTTHHGPRSVTYQLELYHRGLSKHRLLRGPDGRVLQSKARLQAAEWDQQWQTRQAREAVVRTRERATRDRQAQKEYVELRKQEAAEATAEAKDMMDQLRGTLARTLDHDDTIDWERLKPTDLFQEPKPIHARLPSKPVPTVIGPPPSSQSTEFQPRLGLIDRLISSRRALRISEATTRLYEATRSWESARLAAIQADKLALQHWQSVIDTSRVEHEKALEAWEARRKAHDATVVARDASVDALRARYEARDADAVEEYCDMVLAASTYPECFPKEWELEYASETGVLLINYVLPSPDSIPTTTEVKYVQSSDDFANKHLNDKQRASLYDDLLYQATLRTIHEVFEADRISALTAVVFNGIVTSVDRGTDVTPRS